MIKGYILSLSAIALFMLTGCASSAPVPVSALSEIVGTWKSDPPALAIRILPDGSVPAGVTVGKIDENAASQTSNWNYVFSFEEDHLIISNYYGCFETIGSYDVQLLSNGNLEFTVVEDDCALRVNAFMGQRVEPVRDVEWIKVE